MLNLAVTDLLRLPIDLCGSIYRSSDIAAAPFYDTNQFTRYSIHRTSLLFFLSFFRVGAATLFVTISPSIFIYNFFVSVTISPTLDKFAVQMRRGARERT